MSDAAAVRLYHPMWPDGREFDPVVAETMRRQGWTDEPGDATGDDEPDDDGDPIEPSSVSVDAPNPPTTGFGHSTIGGPRG
mgnify:CR=1 FL=1